MPLELTPFPIVPEQRTALTSAGIRQYITSPAWANFGKLEELIESIETQFSTFPITYKSASLPDSANLFDRWVDEIRRKPREKSASTLILPETDWSVTGNPCMMRQHLR